MIEEAKVVLTLLQKRGYQAYYIGGKCRVELHNEHHSEDKVDIKDIDIVTDANADSIKSIFPQSDERGEQFKVVAVKFGGFEFEVATYRKDIYDKTELKNANKIVKPKVETATTLDEDRARRDFTINAIAQNIENEYIDYTYTYRNKKVSSIKDIKERIIRAIGNPKQRFEEDPLRIIRAFRFMSQLGYEIEKQTLKAIVSNLKLVEKIPHERFGPEMNKLIAGRYASAALLMMKEIGFFDLTIKNGLTGQANLFAPGIKQLSDTNFEVLDVFNQHHIDGATLELWTLLLKPLGPAVAKITLESFWPVNKDEVEEIEWLIEHFNIIDEEDLKNSIFKARNGIVKRQGLHCMLELVKRIAKVHVVLWNDEEYKTKSRNLINAFNGRPYFPEQLKITGEQIMELGGEGPGPWIQNAKEKLLYKLINISKYPKEEEKYMEIARECVEEAIFEKTFNEASSK